MNISLTDIGKRFNTEWIFRNFNYQFSTSDKYAITGPNGSGKSTLLQVIGGFVQHSKGTINYQLNGKEILPESIFKYVSMATPYLELIEEMTLNEFLLFHEKTKGIGFGLSIKDIADAVSLTHALDKQIRYYSSGMKQRVKLAQAIFSKTPFVLLDEPLTNLDADGTLIYNFLIENFTNNRILIVSSNDQREYNFCNKVINITDYKQNDNS